MAFGQLVRMSLKHVVWVAAAVVAVCAASFWLHERVMKEPVNAATQIKAVARPLPLEGPGGPILVVSSGSNPFSQYYREILLAEGLNEFSMRDISAVTPALLKRYDVVVLGEIPLSATQTAMLAGWVSQGGNLIAMRPADGLSRRLGLGNAVGVLGDAYLAVNASSDAGKGLVRETIQFHGPANLYRSRSGEEIATLYRDATFPAGFPAVKSMHVGAGRATVFTYDLARSVVYTRQGNPAWSGMERDGIPPMRSDDMFYGAAPKDKQPDWVDMTKVAIPQADEQQRLLVNLILQMNLRKKPLPRFWYFPRGLKAVVVMTGDDHGHGGTAGRFKIFRNESPPNCSMTEWQCIRGTSNIFPGAISDEQALSLVKEGFEIGLHVYTGCVDWPQEKVEQSDGKAVVRDSFQQSDALYFRQLTAFANLYPDLPTPTTTRTDCITWGDYDTQPQVELRHGIRLDTNYYYWPAKWVKNQPGMFTGSGIPMRFAKRDGGTIDVYQAATQMTDESGQSYPFTIDRLLDNALGSPEYVGAFTANMHTDYVPSEGAEAIMRSAKARHVPIVSAVQMLQWLDGRDGSSFQSVTWDSGRLHFAIASAGGSEGLQVHLPVSASNGPLTRLSLNGTPIPFDKTTFAGLAYAAFPATPGKYEATYGRN